MWQVVSIVKSSGAFRSRVPRRQNPSACLVLMSPCIVTHLWTFNTIWWTQMEKLPEEAASSHWCLSGGKAESSSTDSNNWSSDHVAPNLPATPGQLWGGFQIGSLTHCFSKSQGSPTILALQWIYSWWGSSEIWNIRPHPKSVGRESVKGILLHTPFNRRYIEGCTVNGTHQNYCSIGQDHLKHVWERMQIPKSHLRLWNSTHRRLVSQDLGF